VILSCLTLFNLLIARNVLHQRYNIHPTYPIHSDAELDTTIHVKKNNNYCIPTFDPSCIYIINNNGYSALGPVWQEPEPSQATGMALIRCILGKFLGVVCHCFPWYIYICVCVCVCMCVCVCTLEETNIVLA
jgi:hypothetical protein